MYHFRCLTFITIALLSSISQYAATGESHGERKRTELIPDLNGPAPEEMEESRTPAHDAMHKPIESKQDPFPDEEWIETWRKNHKKEVKKQQRIRYNTKLNKDPVRKGALRVRQRVNEKGYRLQRLKRFESLPPEEQKASLERKRKRNNESARKRRITLYGGFSTRKEQQRNKLLELERSGTANAAELEELNTFRHEDRIRYHRKAQKKKDLKNAKTNDSTAGRKKNENGE